MHAERRDWRLVTVEEVAAMALLVASQEGAAITGALLEEISALK